MNLPTSHLVEYRVGVQIREHGRRQARQDDDRYRSFAIPRPPAAIAGSGLVHHRLRQTDQIQYGAHRRHQQIEMACIATAG